MIDVTIIPVLKDNYAYLIKSADGKTAIIDPGEAAPVITELETQNLSLDYILNTHHHGDHIAGNAALIERYSAKLVGPEKEETRITGMDIMLNEGDEFSLGEENIKIIETPGHTTGHICFYFPQSQTVFTGDTLFLMSTGRLFEGSADTMWHSLEKLMVLPNNTKIYCGHEYTLSNGMFCLKIEPNNQDLQKRMEDVHSLRAQNKTTMPSTVGLEKKTNVFIRAGSAEKFAEIRTLKDES